MTCSFCDGEAVFGPYDGAASCERCANRVAKLAERSFNGTFGTIWTSSNQPPPEPRGDVRPGAPSFDGQLLDDFKRGLDRVISADDAETHLDLAVVYREMALYQDALREAAVAFRGARDRKRRDQALAMILTSPLLMAGGLDALSARLGLH